MTLILGGNFIEINRAVLYNFLKLGRFHFVFGGFILFVLGALMALLFGAELDYGRLIFGYLILFFAHLSVSYSNDYFDVEVDKYNKPTLFTGGSGILVQYPELRDFSKLFAILLILISIILAIIFLFVYSFPASFLIFIIIGNMLGWYYSAPPVRLVSRGLGEISTMFTAGILLPGMGYFIMNGGFDSRFLIFVLPLLFYGLAFIINVEIPDMEGDIAGKKYTLITKYDRKFGYTIIAFLFTIASVYFFLLFFIIESIINFMVVGLISLLPLLVGFWGAIKRPLIKDLASKLVTINIISFIFFVVILDLYFIWLMI